MAVNSNTKKITIGDCVTGLTFSNTNSWFAISFQNGDDDPTRNYFDEYHKPLVKIKDFYRLIYNRPFFDHSVKIEQRCLRSSKR